MTRRSLLFAWLSLLGCLTVQAYAAAPGQQEARVAVPVASVHASPSYGSERVTQVLMWDRVLILKTSGEWAKVLVTEQYRTPEGYPGWMLRKDLVTGGAAQLAPTVTVRTAKSALRDAPSKDGKVVAWVYLGTRLVRGEPQDGEWIPVLVPGRKEPVYVKTVTVALDGVATAQDGRNLVDSAAQLAGTPYLWGGMSSQGIDCSGLIYTVYRLYGYELPRDADQQFEVGEPVGRNELAPGDLLFFGKSTNDITHVGMYMWQGKMLHASGSLGVATSPLTDYDYKFQGARRVLGTNQAERLKFTP